MQLLKKIVFFILILTLEVRAEDVDEALWEYGIGFGYVHFAQYPSSDQYTNLLLPFPTFQYRGKRLRADDRDGTRAYLYKEPNLSIELSGGGTVAVDSSGNEARLGMPNLPWVINLGPQLVYNFTPQFDFRLGVFQATTTDFQDTRFAGQILEAQLVYQWESTFHIFGIIRQGHTTGRVSLEGRSGTKSYQDTYFTVRPEFVNAKRRQYDAAAGILAAEFSYFQSFKQNRTALYFGFSVSDYSHSANRMSSLHRSDYNVNYLVGMNYQLAESKKPSVEEENINGFIH